MILYTVITYAKNINCASGRAAMNIKLASEKKKEYIIQAVSALVLAAITALLIAVAAHGGFYGSEASEAFDTVYGYDGEGSSDAVYD